MSHSPTIRAINSYATDAIKQNNPLSFLQRFSPLHNRWHTTSLRNNLGFLLFHWHVVTALKKSHADQIWTGGVQPFTSADWKTQFDWPYNVPMNVVAGDFDSFAGFSSNIENWHNEAHMAVQMVTGEDLMNATTNVYLRNFWRLHYFIDSRFLEALTAFDANGTVTTRITRLEKKYHTRLGDL